MHPGPFPRRRDHPFRIGEVPALDRDLRLLAFATAQRKNAAHERHRAQLDAVDEILAAPMDRVPDLEQVVTLPGNPEVDDRVGVEAIVVGVGDLVPLVVEKCEGRLEPARDGIGQVRNQLPRGDGCDEVLTLAGVDQEAIHVSRQDLAVQDDRRPRVDRSALPVVVGLGLEHLRQLPDLEPHRIREPRRRLDPDLTHAGRCLRLHRDPEPDRLGNGGIQLALGVVEPPAVGREILRAHPLAARLLREGVELRPEGHQGLLVPTLRRRLLRVPQFPELHRQIVELPLRQGLDVPDDLRPQAATRDLHAGGAVQELAPDRDLEGRPLPAARGIDVSDVGPVLTTGSGSPRGHHGQQEHPR